MTAILRHTTIILSLIALFPLAGCLEEDPRCFDVRLDEPLRTAFLDAQAWWNARDATAGFSTGKGCASVARMGAVPPGYVAFTNYHAPTVGDDSWTIRFDPTPDLPDFDGFPASWDLCPLETINIYIRGQRNRYLALDFYTYARHELGHVLGYGHSTDQLEIMFPLPRRQPGDPPCF